MGAGASVVTPGACALCSERVRHRLDRGLDVRSAWTSVAPMYLTSSDDSPLQESRPWRLADQAAAVHPSRLAAIAICSRFVPPTGSSSLLTWVRSECVRGTLAYPRSDPRGDRGQRNFRDRRGRPKGRRLQTPRRFPQEPVANSTGRRFGLTRNAELLIR